MERFIKKITGIKFKIFITALAVVIGPLVAYAVVQSLNGQTGQTQSFANDANVVINSANDIHALGWTGQLPVSRGGTGNDTFAEGSVIFMGQNRFRQDNNYFFWDRFNNRLGIGTSSPIFSLDVVGSASISGNLTVTGSVASANLVPYVGATNSVNLGPYNLTAASLVSVSDANIHSINIGLGGGSVVNNMAVGVDALEKTNSNSYANTAVGYKALENQGGAGDSTAVGAVALVSNTTGDGNTAVGSAAMRENITGNFNIAMGSAALRFNTIGNSNVALGTLALQQNNGSNNIAVGFRAGLWQADGSFLTSPEDSIYIGTGAKGYDDNDSNSIVLGYNTTGAGANTAVIGNPYVGNVYFGSATGQANIHAKRMFAGFSGSPGCIAIGDSDENGVTYITANDGVLIISTIPPPACQ